MLIYLQMIETEEEQRKFEIVYRRYRGELFTLAYDILKNEHDAEDVVHHAFLKLVENIKKIEGPLSLRTKGYIATIVENRAIDVYRSKKAHPTVPFGDGAADINIDAPECSDLYDCILKLPVRQRSIIILKYHYGYELKEIAKMLGITYANALKIDYRAKERLKELCGEAEIEW